MPPADVTALAVAAATSDALLLSVILSQSLTVHLRRLTNLFTRHREPRVVFLRTDR